MAQGLGGERVLRFAGRPAPTGEQEHPVDRGERRVDVVRDEDHGHAPPPVPVGEELHGRLLVVQIQAEQRLVAQQDLGIADQGLGDAQALLLAPRQPPDRGVRIWPRPHQRQHLVDSAVDAARAQGGSPSVSIQTQGHEIAPAQGQVGVEGPLLRDVADRLAAAPGHPPKHLHAPAIRRLQAQERAQEGGLAAAVGAEDGQELAARHGEGEVAPEGLAAQPQGRPVEQKRGDLGHHFPRPSARRSGSSWESIHC